MFSEWLMDQMDRSDDIGRFARLVWADYTSGCARWYAGAVEWRDHFIAKHPDKADDMMALLGETFRAYADDRMVKQA